MNVLRYLCAASVVAVSVAQSGSGIGSGVGSGSGSGEGNVTLPNCTCKSQWTNSDKMCNPANTRFTDHQKNVEMQGCPSLATIATCEWNPAQSWCETNEEHCAQQISDSVNKSWVYCDPVSQEPELPICTCKSRWYLKEGGSCPGTGLAIDGCPTYEQMQVCDPSFDPYGDWGQPWCETNEEECREQENGPGDSMVGESWAYCSPVSQETELPACECQSSWRASRFECRQGANRSMGFSGCPSVADIVTCEGSDWSSPDQTWCMTTRDRCREQTYSETSARENMIGEAWAYCSPANGKPELPNCECLGRFHSQEQCADGEYLNDIKGCPAQNTLVECGIIDADEPSFCNTLHVACKQQNYEALDDGWSYCDANTQDPVLANCECSDSWWHQTDDCSLSHGGHPEKMGGCPTLEEIQRCEPYADHAWCYTKDQACAQQFGSQVDAGWVKCDPASGRALGSESEEPDVGGIIAVSVASTMVFAAAVVFVLFLVYKRYSLRHRDKYDSLMMRKLAPNDQ